MVYGDSDGGSGDGTWRWW
jgi:uncharacterized membrane protein